MSSWVVALVFAGGYLFTYRRTYLAIASDDLMGADDAGAREAEIVRMERELGIGNAKRRPTPRA